MYGSVKICAQASANYADSSVQLGVANSRGTSSESNDPIPLRVSHLLGAFGLMLFGHGIALIFFIGELIAGRRKLMSKAA